MTDNTHSALRWLHLYGRRYPHAWRQYALFLADPPVQWPSWCFCPIAGAYAIISDGSSRQLSIAEAADVGPLAGLAAWRATQGIYRFDETLMHALLETSLSGDLPTEVLLRLPAWCVYIETPGVAFTQGALAVPLRGFWAFVEYDANDRRRELRLLLDFAGFPVPGQLVVHLGGTLLEGIRHSLREARIEALRAGLADSAPPLDLFDEEDLRRFEGLVSLVLYLCADEAELSARLPLPPRVVQGKKRPLCPAAQRPVIIEAGVRLGAKLAAAKARAAAPGDETGASRMPHVRAAHWHHYWTGKRSDPAARRLIVRWLSPVLVGFADEDVQPVVRRVDDSGGEP